MSRHDDQRIYRTFEEFEREELRRADSLGAAVDDLFDDMFNEELNFDRDTRRRSYHDDAASDDEE